MKMPSTCLVDSIRDGPPADQRVRLTRYSQKLDLSECPQLKEPILLLSVLPNLFLANLKWRKSLKSFLKNPENNERNQELSNGTLPFLSLGTVKEVDVSKCQRLDYKVAIKCFSKSFPSLRKLRAAYLSNIKVFNMFKLHQNFCELTGVDLTVDISPVISNLAQTPFSISLTSGSNYYDFCQTRCSLSNITRLTLEGRSDICRTVLILSYHCIALEDLLLRHNGSGIQKTFLLDATLMFSMLRLVSLDVCDAKEGDFDVP